jgi:hypothetical protein
MPRKLRTAKTRHESVPLAFQHYLLHGHVEAALAVDAETSWLDLLRLTGSQGPSRAEQRAVWLGVRDELLAEWIAQRPGTRPHGWWIHDAPMWTTDVPPRAHALAVTYREVWDLRQPRTRVGGVGTPIYEALNYVPAFVFGLPERFVSAEDVLLYNGRSRDVHGHPIGTYRDGGFPYAAIDPNDPPVYESQTTYLERHRFLSAAERRAVPADAWLPERVRVDGDDDPSTAA